jgi:ABC-type multidrug transport system fused ATPase/permease subunit
MKLLLTLLWRQARNYPLLYSLLAVFVLLTSALWIAEPLFARFAIDAMLLAKEGQAVDYQFLFIAWGVLFVSMSVIQTIQKYIGWKVSEWLVLDHRERVYTHVLNLGLSFHTRQKSGEIVKILDNAADTLADLQRQIFIQLFPSFLAASVFLVIGFWMNALMALVLIGSIFLYLLIAFIGTQRTMKFQNAANSLWIKSIGRAYDAVTNIYSVKSGAQQNRELKLMHDVHVDTYKAQQKVNVRWAMVEAINFFMLTRILLISIGIYLYTKNVMTLGEVYFFQTSFFRVLTPFEMLGGMLPQWNKQIGRVRLSQDILDTVPDVVSKSDAVKLRDIQGEIRLEHVHFSYAPEKVLTMIDDHAPPLPIEPPKDEELEEPNASDPSHDAPKEPGGDKETMACPDDEDRKPGTVLRDVNLVIKPGEHMAFVGHSGAGKTTLAMLLNRFYDVTQGRILVDGVDMRDLDLHWWQSQIGLVLQENIMFNDSILENIRYARPDATLEEVQEAARRAAADEFIEALPNKYNTLIGDRGIRLSGGQRQRVAIARAILKQPTIVILDEATSALDSVTEKHVQEGIKSLVENRTAAIIAHRLSTVRSVDRIAVFDKGMLIDVGPHEELVKRCAIYKEMVELQSQGLLAEE